MNEIYDKLEDQFYQEHIHVRNRSATTIRMVGSSFYLVAALICVSSIKLEGTLSAINLSQLVSGELVVDVDHASHILKEIPNLTDLT